MNYFIETFQASDRGQKVSANWWLFYSVGLASLPFTAFPLLYWMVVGKFSYAPLVEGAQLAIFAVAIAAATFPKIYRPAQDSRSGDLKFSHMPLAIGIVVLIFGCALFAVANLPSELHLKAGAIVCISFSLLAVSIIIGWFVELRSLTESVPDVRGIRVESEEELRRKFRSGLEDQ